MPPETCQDEPEGREAGMIPPPAGNPSPAIVRGVRVAAVRRRSIDPLVRVGFAEEQAGKGALDVRLRFEILARDRFTCQYCGRQAPFVVLHVDHIVPRSSGGSNEPSNLRTACVDCNLGKGASPVSDQVEQPAHPPEYFVHILRTEAHHLLAQATAVLKGLLDQAVSLLDGSTDATLDALETLGRDALRGGAKVNRLCKRAASNYAAVIRLQRETGRAQR